MLIPITKNEPEKNKVLRELRAAASQINSRRNAVVHQGEFCNTEEAKEIISSAGTLINGIIGIYEPAFRLGLIGA